jgi:uncharacterized protein
MKKIIILFFILFSSIFVFAESISKPQGYVLDNANIISAEAKTFLENLTIELEQKTSAELAVVVINSLDNESIEMYAVKLFEKWGIGKKGKDNGILLLVALNDRRVRIEVGYGLEGVINDGKAGEIIRDEIIPYFKQDDYSGGILAGTISIVKILSEYYNVQIDGLNGEYAKTFTKQNKNSWVSLLFFLLMFLLFGFRGIFFPLIFGGRGNFWGGGGGGFGGGSFGGGFGGGMSGGGGASGRW